MNNNFARLFFGVSLILAAAMAFGQHGGGGRGGGGGHSSGGGFSGGHGYSGGSSRSFGSSFRSSGGSSHYGGSSGYSHSLSRSGQNFGSRSSSSYSSGSRYSSSSRTGSSSSTSRYSNRSSSSTDRSFEQSHASESRSGRSSYSGNNNGNTGRTASANDARIGTAPRGAISPSSLRGVIGGNGGFGDRGFRHGGFGFRGGFRFGYFGYGPFWRDSFFCFPFYCFDPFLVSCYVSPWYYYPCLPGYVAAPNVIIETVPSDSNWSGRDYDWSPENSVKPNAVLNDSVQDLVHSFESDDHKAIDRVTPHSGNVRIFVDGKYSYSLKANDFYDTYVDGIESTKIDRYQIIDVKEGNDGTARVIAKHVYNDPWGKKTFVYHSYLLVKEGDEYVIREFGTSNKATS